MQRPRLTRQQLVIGGAGTACIVVGLLVGLLIPQGGIRSLLAPVVGRALGESDNTPDDPHAGHDHGGHGDEAGDRVVLSDDQIANLDLDLQRVELVDDKTELRVPGRIIERPGFSNLTVASTVTGVVSRVHVVPGQAIRPGQALVDLRLTGEALATAQSSLLRELTELESVEKEIARLEPFVQSGSVPGKQIIQLKYDRDQSRARIRVRKQELLLYGLRPEQVETIVESGELVEELVVRLPAGIVDDMATTPISAPVPAGRRDQATNTVPVPAGRGDQATNTAPTETARLGPATNTDWRFTIERLDAHPGQSVKPGDPLVKLAHHTELFVEGHAFENEIGWIEDLEEKDWTVKLEHGTEGFESYLDGLRVLYLDNHVDVATRTFNFYLPLVNSPILPDRVDASGTVYRTWRFKPGQLVHVLVPKRELKDVYRVPLDAVADEGLESYVFRRGRRRHEVEDGEIVEKWEFVRTPVRIVHRSTTHAFLAPSGDIPDGRTVVMNKAHLLLLATKEDHGGGGHAHHGHSH